MIDKNLFKEITNKTPLKQQEDNNDIVKDILVYRVPESWINIIKKRKIPISVFFKLAVQEKLERDNLL